MEKETFIKPDKPFWVLGTDSDGRKGIFYCETEKEALWIAHNNTRFIFYDIIEIGSYREIEI